MQQIIPMHRNIQQAAKLALKEMVRQTGDCVFDRDGYMIRRYNGQAFNTARAYKKCHKSDGVSEKNIWRSYIISVL